MKFYDPKDFESIIVKCIADHVPVGRAYTLCKTEAGKWTNGAYRVCSLDMFATYYMLRKGQIKQEGKNDLS